MRKKISKALGVIGLGLLLLHNPIRNFFESPAHKIIKNTVEVIGDYGLGSGTIIKSDDNGSLILTNKHVCAINKEPIMLQGVVELMGLPVLTTYLPFKVVIEGQPPVEGIVVEAAQNVDLCIISVASLRNHSTVNFASKQGRVGDKIMTAGYSLGFPLIVSEGFLATQELADNAMFQFASLLSYPGSSGSGVFNSDGDLVGVIAIGLRGSPSITGLIPLRNVIDFAGQFN